MRSRYVTLRQVPDEQISITYSCRGLVFLTQERTAGSFSLTESENN